LSSLAAILYGKDIWDKFGGSVKLVKILAIGNSFSQDAMAYLHKIAACGGIETKAVNLYIGGCSLQTHWENIEKNLSAYSYELNGASSGRMVSIDEALKEESWDFITLQQASHDSGIPETYYPYIRELSVHVGKCVPGARQLIHQTWAYDIGSEHPAFSRYHNDQNEMYAALTMAYASAAADLHLELIPCGRVIQELRRDPLFDVENGGQTLCRDGFHMHIVYGRYAAAAVWYEKLLQKSILDNTFAPSFDDGSPANEKLVAAIKQTVHRVAGER
jgi:hypothetical protein